MIRFAKSSDHTISQIARKYKSILMFLGNPSNCFTGTLSKTMAISKMKVYVVLFVCGLQPLTNVTKNSILGVTGVLDPPLELYNVF